MALDLQDMTISKVVIHTVPIRTQERTPGAPVYAQTVIKLPAASAVTFQKRITDSLGKSSHGIEVSINDERAQSFFQAAAALMHAGDSDFLNDSRLLADKLAECQANRDLPASKLIIATGKCGSGKKRFLVAIKAELQDGFLESGSSLAHLNELFLTPSQKLFKMAFLNEVVAAPAEDGLFSKNNYTAHLFDHLMTALETKSAAYYFYASFFGAIIADSDKKKTRDFFDLTRQFINNAPIPREEKLDLLDALRVDLKGNSAIIHVEKFADQHMNESISQAYVDFMLEENFPRTAVTKDTEFIKARLKRRQKMRFHGGVEITAPPDEFNNLVTVQDEEAGKTTIIINSVIESVE
jgi:hypothetical protein